MPRNRVQIVVAVTVVLFIGAWAALRDVSHRLDAGARQRAATTTSTTNDAGISSVLPGPRLGDLRDLSAYANVGALPEPLKMASTTTTPPPLRTPRPMPSFPPFFFRTPNPPGQFQRIPTNRGTSSNTCTFPGCP